MRKLKLKKLSILSQSEKKAKQIDFSLAKNIILGANETGKSSILKSLYYAFGAEVKFSSEWKPSDKQVSLSFAIDDDEYTVYRHESLIAFFDKDGKLMKHFIGKVTKELSPFLSELLKFKIALPNRDNTITQLPPAYLFVPFYIDQDNGWQAKFSSFSQLSQFSKWETPIIYYHTGIRPNDYYTLSAKFNAIKEKQVEIEKELNILNNLFKKINKNEIVPINGFDEDNFKEEIERLIVLQEKNKKKRNEYKSKLIDLINKKHLITQQIEIAKSTAEELNKDYIFSSENNEKIICPMCNAEYENSFRERFAIAESEDTCNSFLIELQEELNKLSDDISELREESKNKSNEINEIEEILNTKKEKVTFKDILAAQGRKELDETLLEEIRFNERKLSESTSEIDKTKKKLKSFDDNKKKKEIKKMYLTQMKHFLSELNVHNLEEDSYNSFTSKIKSSGSELPRALLAHCFALLETIHKNTTSTFCPIIIDTPNQQGQDETNLPKIIEFIISNTPNKSQLILGVESTARLEINEHIIELKNEKHKLLEEKSFQSISEKFNKYKKACLPN